MLDQTAIVWLNELDIEEPGYAPSSRSSNHHHERNHVPTLIIEGAGGALRQNMVIDAQQRHYHDSLVTLAPAMGLTDVRRFGDDGTAPVTELLA